MIRKSIFKMLMNDFKFASLAAAHNIFTLLAICGEPLTGAA